MIVATDYKGFSVGDRIIEDWKDESKKALEEVMKALSSEPAIDMQPQIATNNLTLKPSSFFANSLGDCPKCGDTLPNQPYGPLACLECGWEETETPTILIDDGLRVRAKSPEINPHCLIEDTSTLFSHSASTPLPPPFATLPKPQPKEDAPIVDFWCGGGGVGTAGFLQVGFQIGVNIDRDPKNPKLSDAIADCYELNFGKPVIRETLQDYADRGGFKSQHRPDVVVFTQSCKNLSKANQNASEDESDIAVAQAAARGLEELLPSIFVVENVSEYKNSECFKKIIGQVLRRNGYRYCYDVLNALSYGVAQDRKRFILIAVHKHTDTVALPNITTSEPLGWYQVCADLIDSFPITQPAPWQLKGLKDVGKGKSMLIDGRCSSQGVPGNREPHSPAFTLGNLAKGMPRVYLVERAGARNNAPQIRESSSPSWTVKASVFTDGKGANRQDGINTLDGKGEWRRVTNRGVARLMGLYDWYQLPNSPSVFGPLLGNGLPSEMARAIGEHLKQYLPETKTGVYKIQLDGSDKEILMAGGNTTHPQLTQVLRLEPQVAEPVSNSTGEPLCPNRLRSHSVESSISPHFLKKKTADHLAAQSNTSLRYTMNATISGTTIQQSSLPSELEIIEAIGAQIQENLSKLQGNLKKKNSLKQAEKNFQNWKKFKILADAGIPLRGIYVAKTTADTVTLGTLEELGTNSVCVVWQGNSYQEPEQLGNLIPASLRPHNEFAPGDRVSFGDSANTGTLKFFADGEPVVKFDSGHQMVVGFRTLESVGAVQNISELILGTLKKEWQSDIAIASSLFLPLVEVKKELLALASEKKASPSPDGLQWKACAVKSPDPIVPYALIIKAREHSYKLPEFFRTKVLHQTSNTVRVEFTDGKQKNISKDKVHCINCPEDWERFQNQYLQFQSALGEYEGAVAALDRYDMKLEALGGYKIAPNPITPTVILTDDPSDTKLGWIYGWKAPFLTRLGVNKHTPQMMRLLKDGTEYSLNRQDSGFCCPSDEDWKRVLALHEKATRAGEEIEKLLEALQTYEQKEKTFTELGDSKPQDTEITLNTDSGGATQDDIGSATEEEDSVQPHNEVVQPETLTERVHALLKPEKRLLTSIAEELDEDFALVAKALFALLREGRALRIGGAFWSLPTPSVTQSEDRLDWKVGSRVESQMSGAAGELTRNLKTKVSIWWDKDKEMGLKPMDYTEEDLEVMRIGLLPTPSAEYLSLVEANLSSAISVEQPNSSGDEQPLTEWQAYGYTWTFDPASKIIQCEKLWWELEKFSLCFDDFTGNGDSTQINPNQSPQSWLDDWMEFYPDRFSNVLFSNNKLATEGEGQVREQEAESRRQFKAGDRVSTSFGEGTILAINNAMASIAWDDDSQTYKPGALIEAKHLKLVRERDDDIDPIQEAIAPNSTTTDTRLSPHRDSLLWLNPDDIIIDAGTQSRLKEDEERINDYKRDMNRGEWEHERLPLPRVAINEDGRYYAIDCHHRVKAGRKSERCDRMLFEVHQATLAQARLWSSTANTQHGLGADNSPSGVRKRIEMFLDNIEFLSPEQYQSEFEKVPDLTPTERKTGKFSDRTITRYLRLRPTQNRTVGNIRKERELAAQFARIGLEEGVSRVEVVADNPDRPIGVMGLVMQLDRKSGVWVKWDADGKVWAIHPDLIAKTDKPKPLAVAARSTPTNKPTRTVKSLVESAAQSFGLTVQGDSLLPDVTPETPDQGSPAVVTPYQEQTSTTPNEYAKTEASLAVQDTACAMSRLSSEQWGEVLEAVAQMGVSDRHFQEAIKAAEGVLLSRASLPQVG